VPRSRRTFSRQTLDAAEVLGQQVAQARRERRLTLEELAERAGVAPFTVSKVERGDPTVALGTAFEVARLVGVPLFGVEDRTTMAGLVRQGRDRLTLLPARVRTSAGEAPDGDF
jgi:DNA-binding XRE family transcriptional regulator